MSKKTTTLWRLADIYINFIISLVKGMLIVPLYLAYIDPRLYGAWLATGNILMWLTLFDPGVGDIATQRIAQSYAMKDSKKLGCQISNSIILSSVICIVTLLIGLLISNFLLGKIIRPEDIEIDHLRKAFSITMVGTAFTLFYFSLSGSIVGLQKTRITAIVRNGVGILSILINVILLLKGYRLNAIAYSTLFSALTQVILYTIVLFFVLKKERIRIFFDFPYFKEYSKIFTYTFFSKALSTISQNIDLLIVSRFIGLELVPILEFSRRPIQFIRSLASGPSIALIPSLSFMSGENESSKLKALTTRSTLLITLIGLYFCTGIIIFNQSFVSIWVGKQYYIGNLLNLILAVTFLFSLIGYTFQNITYSLGKIKENSLFEMFKNIFSLLLVFLFSYCFGLYGVVISAFVVTITTDLWFYPFLLNKIIKFDFNDLRNKLINISIICICFIGLIYIIKMFVNINGPIIFISVVFLFTIIAFIVYMIFSLEFRELFFQVKKKLVFWKS
jgi:O-antigen/teichoic acid export membrane protein